MKNYIVRITNDENKFYKIAVYSAKDKDTAVRKALEQFHIKHPELYEIIVC